MTIDSAFPVNPVLTAIAMGYTNEANIADLVMPRIPPFVRQTFKYTFFSAAQHFTIPSTLVGRRSIPDEVEFVGEDKIGQTYDYGLDDVIPNTDIAENPQTDLVANATEGLTELIALDREVRVAGHLQNPANFANKATLSGTSKWTDPASTPIQDISGMLDAPMVRPNIMVMGRPAWSALITNPQILKAVSVSGTDQGIATRRAILELFDIEDILIGQARRHAGKRGDALNLQQIWGPHVSLIRRDPLALNSNRRLTFGFTAQFGERVAGEIPEPKQGLRGSVRVRVGESVGETIVSDQAGALLQNVA